jgi:streptogramin lyase
MEPHVTIREFADLPQYSGAYVPSAIASGLKNSLWVTDTIDQDFGENVVTQIAPSGKPLNNFYYTGRTSEGAGFVDIVAGPDGNLWITDEYNDQILRMDTRGNYTSFPLSVIPFGITVGPDKALWFTELGAIGRITTKGHVTRYISAGDNENITAGPDGALWFTDYSDSAIGRITTSGKVTKYTKGISPGSGPYYIAAGPDGELWFTENLGGRIGRITTSGQVSEYSRGITSGEKPNGIAAGPEGSMWFTESIGSYSGSSTEAKIGRIGINGRIDEYSRHLTPNSNPFAIVEGPNKAMWFVESASDKTGRLSL